MSIENQTDATAAVDQTLIALALKWRAVTAKAKQDRSMLEDADMLAFSCLILAAEWGDHLTESVNPVLEENEKLINVEWTIYSDIEKLVWRLCRRDKEAESMLDLAMESLIEYYLTHHNSAIRIWAMEVGWMIRPWLPAHTVVPLMLKNVADTIGGVRLAMGLALGLCTTEIALETFITEYEPEESYMKQYANRIELFRKEGFFLSQTSLLGLECRCRQIIEREILGGQNCEMTQREFCFVWAGRYGKA